MANQTFQDYLAMLAQQTTPTPAMTTAQRVVPTNIALNQGTILDRVKMLDSLSRSTPMVQPQPQANPFNIPSIPQFPASTGTPQPTQPQVAGNPVSKAATSSGKMSASASSNSHADMS